MIRFIYILLLICPGVTLGASKTPRSQTGHESGLDFRLIKKYDDFNFLAETKNRQEFLGQDYHQILTGLYYRISKKFRVGLFLQAEQGLRWDSDWIKNSSWEWGRISNRWDYSSVSDFTFQDLITNQFSWDWKNRLIYYHSREALLFKTRPGLRYFFLKDAKPWLQIYAEFEAYVPLNYGLNAIYESWSYIGALYQINDEFSFGPTLSFRERWYHSYSDFKTKTQEDYRVSWSSIYYGLTLNYLIP